MTIEKELDSIKKAMKADPALAWGWHCNIACASQDEGMGHAASNRAAARFMMSAFGVDVKDYSLDDNNT